MLSFIEYLGIPKAVGIFIIGLFFVSQLLGEILELKGRVVPEFLKIRKRFARRRREREAMRKLPDFMDKQEAVMINVSTTLADMGCLYQDIKEHYSADNIAKRDGWMKEVNEHIVDSESRRSEQAKALQEQAETMKLLADKLDKNSADTLEILINNKRDYLLNFTTKAADMTCPLTKEQYQRFFTVHREYEQLIEDNGKVNGQVDVAYNIVTRSFEERMKQHAFIEDHWHDI